MHVLVVNDEPLAQRALTNIVAARPEVEVFDTASDTAEALDKLMHRSFDVLLLDVSMPEVSGMELLDQLTALGRLVPPVLFVTAWQWHALGAFKRHAIDYVLKPFSSERIEEALDAVFRRSDRQRAVGVRRLFRTCKGSLRKSARRSRSKPTAQSGSLLQTM